MLLPSVTLTLSAIYEGILGAVQQVSTISWACPEDVLWYACVAFSPITQQWLGIEAWLSLCMSDHHWQFNRTNEEDCPAAKCLSGEQHCAKPGLPAVGAVRCADCGDREGALRGAAGKPWRLWRPAQRAERGCAAAGAAGKCFCC